MRKCTDSTITVSLSAPTPARMKWAMLGRIGVGWSLFLGIALAAIDLFDLPCSPPAVSLAGLAVITCVHLPGGGRRRTLAAAGVVLAACLLVAVVGWSPVLRGMALCANRVMERLGRQTGSYRLPFAIPEGGSEGVDASLFACLCGAVLALLCTLPVRGALYLPTLFFQLRYGLFPAAPVQALLLFSGLFLAGWTCQHWPGPRGSRVGGARTPAYALCALGFVALIFGAALLLGSPADYEAGALSDGVQRGAARAVYTLRYGDDRVSSYTGGDFTRLGDLAPGEDTALSVTMSRPESLYLRGYVGSRYTGSGWADLDSGQYYEAGNLFYWLHDLGFSGLNQLAAVADLGLEDEAEEITVSIENIGAGSRYLYAPYELTTSPAELEQVYSPDDAALVSAGLTGSRSYTYTARENLVKQYDRVAAAYYGLDTGEAEDYAVRESHYNAYVYRTYTDIPEDTCALLQSLLGDVTGEDGSHMAYEQAEGLVIATLAEQVSYAEQVAPLPGDTDFLQHFLVDTKTGYAAHYATAAAMMYRYLGIPARYVEGYLITPEDVQGAEPYGTLNITGKNAHAWVEIYQDGLGWLPVEVTPAYAGVMERAGGGAGGGAGVWSRPETEIEREDVGEQEQQLTRPTQPLPSGRALRIAGIALLLLLLAAPLALLVRKRLQVRRRRASLLVPDNNLAVRRMFSYTLDILGHDGITPGPGSLYGCCPLLEARYSAGYRQKFQRALDLRQEAVYSPHRLSARDRAYVQGLMESTLELVLLSKSPLQKLRLKLWAGLY